MSQEQHPALSAERIALRERLGLRVVRSEEEGRHIVNQLNGVYGFTGAPSSEELPIFIKPVYRCFEVLKLTGGEVAIVGYITDKEQMVFDSGAEPIMLHLYPDPHGESARLVSVQLSRVDRRRPPSRDDGNPMLVEIAPIG
jgi:hypothetical protein